MLKYLLLTLALFVGSTNASLIESCSTLDATANGNTANYCSVDTILESSDPVSETENLSNIFVFEDLEFVAKYEDGSYIGWEFVVGEDYSYTLTVPDVYPEASGFILGIKQGTQMLSYVFNDIDLTNDIVGTFSINDYSHVSAWIDNPTSVPEPGSLGLLGAGLLGLGATRKLSKK